MPQSRRVIGVDETGKGDFFGPLVVAAFLASDDDIPKLQELGVRDSKTLSDARIATIADHLRERFPNVVLVCTPEQYNQRYSIIKNLNILLAEEHAEAISRILHNEPADLAISDKFGKPELIERELKKRKSKIAMQQITGGERIPQVAAASILARAEFVHQMEQFSKQFDMEIPKGAAAHVDEAGRRLVARYGADVLKKVAKIHFKNYGRALANTLISR
jgi:ribonuclease HIII